MSYLYEYGSISGLNCNNCFGRPYVEDFVLRHCRNEDNLCCHAKNPCKPTLGNSTEDVDVEDTNDDISDECESTMSPAFQLSSRGRIKREVKKFGFQIS